MIITVDVCTSNLLINSLSNTCNLVIHFTHQSTCLKVNFFEQGATI